MQDEKSPVSNVVDPVKAYIDSTREVLNAGLEFRPTKLAGELAYAYYLTHLDLNSSLVIAE